MLMAIIMAVAKKTPMEGENENLNEPFPVPAPGIGQTLYNKAPDGWHHTQVAIKRGNL
jgi:hypothetical protein